MPTVTHVEDVESYAYDSDEEDRRNGVPTAYSSSSSPSPSPWQSSGLGSGAFRASMKDEAMAEFRLFQRRASKLTSQLRERESHYERLRQENEIELFLYGHFRTAEQWEEELAMLVDGIWTLRAELYTVQEKMEHRYAQLYSFLDHRRPAQRDQHHWHQFHRRRQSQCRQGEKANAGAGAEASTEASTEASAEVEVDVGMTADGIVGLRKEGDIISWSLDGTDVRRPGFGEEIKLEWNGVEYNSMTPAQCLEAQKKKYEALQLPDIISF